LGKKGGAEESSLQYRQVNERFIYLHPSSPDFLDFRFFQIKFSVSMLHDGNCPYTVFALGEPGKIIPEEKNLSPAAAGDFALAGLFARKGIEGALALSSLKNGRTCGLLRHRHSGFSTPKSTHLRFKRQGALIPYTCVK